MDAKTREDLKKVLRSKINRQLLYYLDICARCSICRDACHQYVITKDVLYLPAYRAELIRRIYKKYYSPLGRIFPGLYEGREIDDEKLLDELHKTSYACTGCRRCMYYCPFSIDTTWILSVAKEMLNAAGKGLGAQSKILFDKTIEPTEGIYELPLEKIYLGATIRLEVSVPGFKTIDKNIMLHTNRGYTSLNLVKVEQPDEVLLADCYGSLTTWQSIQSKIIYSESIKQFQEIIKKERAQERNTFLGALFLVLLFTAVVYLIAGPVGVLVVIIFAFYYHEKNKLNTWSDVSK